MGFCEPCSDFAAAADCMEAGLNTAGAAACAACPRDSLAQTKTYAREKQLKECGAGKFNNNDIDENDNAGSCEDCVLYFSNFACENSGLPEAGITECKNVCL